VLFRPDECFLARFDEPEFYTEGFQRVEGEARDEAGEGAEAVCQRAVVAGHAEPVHGGGVGFGGKEGLLAPL
jgi:hypothetical protein